MREEKRRKEEEEKEARKRAEEEERRRREEEEEARRRAEEEEEERRRMEEEEARRKAEEEEARRRAEEEEAARIAQEAEIPALSLVREPQTREDPDIELVTEEMLDDNLPIQETEEEGGEEVNTSSHTEEEQAKDEELEDEELDLEINGTPAEAGPQLDEKEEDEDLENQTLGESDSKPVLPSDEVSALKATSPGEGLDKKAPSDTSTPFKVEQKRVRTPALNKGPLSRSQEKREQRRRRGLEHNQRETERASSSVVGKDEISPPKNKSQETSRLKERVDSKELDQYTFVAWKMKEDKGGKKEARSSPPSTRPVRPSTLSLQPAEPVPERNGTGEGAGVVNLHRRPGAIKEKPEKWRGRRSDGEFSDGTSPPKPHNREERRKKQPLYVFSSGYSQIYPHVLSLTNGNFFSHHIFYYEK